MMLFESVGLLFYPKDQMFLQLMSSQINHKDSIYILIINLYIYLIELGRYCYIQYKKWGFS